MNKVARKFDKIFRPQRYAFHSAIDEVLEQMIARVENGESFDKVIARYVRRTEPRVWWDQQKQTWAFSEPFGSYAKMPEGKELLFEEGRGGTENDYAVITGVDWDEHHDIYYLDFPEGGPS